MVKLTIALLLTTATALAQHPLDTIGVQRLVVDTSSNLLAPFPRPARLMPLLEVRELHNEKEDNPYWANCFNCTWSDYHKHLWYLTRLKAPIPFGWVVFEAIILPDQVQAPKITPHEWPLEPTDSARDGALPNDSLLISLSDLGESHALFGSSNTDSIPRWIDFTPTTISPGPGFYDWLPRRLRKRYLKYLKTHPHE